MSAAVGDAPPRGRATLRASMIVVVALIATAGCCLLPFRVTYPPLQDLPNHLARISVLRSAADAPVFWLYEIHWDIIPNLLVDVFLVALAQLLPLAIASKLLVGAAFALWVVAPFALHWAVYRRLSIIPLVGVLGVLNAPLEMGFLSFYLGTALAALALAAWIVLDRAAFHWLVVLAVAVGLLLFFVHLAAFGEFALAVIIWELVRRRDALRTRLWLLALAIGPAIALFAAEPHRSLNPTVPAYEGGPTLHGILDRKLDQILNFSAASPDWSWGVLAGLAGLAAMTLVFARHRPDLRLGLIALAFALLFLALPYSLGDAAYVDSRMLAPLFLFASAWLTIGPVRALGSVAFGLAVLAIFTGELRLVALTWSGTEGYYRSYERTTASLPAGARLFWGVVGVQGGRLWYGISILHFGAFATLEKGAVVQTLFAAPSQQPIQMRPQLRAQLAKLVTGDFPTTADIDWPAVRENFDYVLLAATAPPDVPADLRQLAADGYFHLYAIAR